MKSVKFIVLVLILGSCASESHIEIDPGPIFKIPQIIDVKFENRLHPSVDSMEHSYVQISGIFNFELDSISLMDPENITCKSKNSTVFDSLNNSQWESKFEIFVHDNLILDSVAGSNARSHSRIPAFIVNNSTEMQSFGINYESCDAILEAKDSSGTWKPIEHSPWTLVGCYSGPPAIRIQPQEYLVISFPAYEGEYSTKLRLKCLINDKNVYSNEFSGTINYGQFHLPLSSPEYINLQKDSSYSELLFLEPSKF